jgi:hypothetical protein
MTPIWQAQRIRYPRRNIYSCTRTVKQMLRTLDLPNCISQIIFPNIRGILSVVASPWTQKLADSGPREACNILLLNTVRQLSQSYPMSASNSCNFFPPLCDHNFILQAVNIEYFKLLSTDQCLYKINFKSFS